MKIEYNGPELDGGKKKEEEKEEIIYEELSAPECSYPSLDSPAYG